MGIVLGVTAALCWGAADFLARFSSRRVGFYSTLFFMQFIGLASLSLYLASTGEFGRLTARMYLQAWAWALVAALLNTISYLALYRALEVGLLAIVSPIVSGYAAVTVVLAVLSGERLSLSHEIGIGTVLIGVVLTTIPHGQRGNMKLSAPASLRRRTVPPGIGCAFTAALGFGVTFWLLGVAVTPILGGIAPVWLFRLTPLCLLAPLSALLHQPIRLPHGQVWVVIMGVGLLDTVAYIASMLGLATGQLAVVSVLTSLYSAVAVALAWVFLREKLHWGQWAGIGLIFVGITLVNL
jgi:drug/metabolite transporter (DMT)-like permease